MQSKAVRYAIPLIAALAILASPSALHAQGCAMCYQSAAASGARLIHALKNGIIIMMFPPMLITFGIARLAYKKRNEFRDGAAMPENDPVDANGPIASNEIILNLDE
jgi:hypothetical protein